MYFFKNLSKIQVNNFIFSFFLIELFIFIVNIHYLSITIIITHTIIILTLLIWYIVNIDFSNAIKKLSNIKYIFLFCITLVFLYSTKINYSEHLNQSITCKKLKLIYSYADCSYSIFYLFTIGILFLLLFYFNKLKIDLIKVFIWIGLIIIIISIINLVIYYSLYLGIIKKNYLSNIFPFRGIYSFYFQFLPFAIDGKRNTEILFFALPYASTLIFFLKNEKSKLNYLSYVMFVASFLTYSKNLWINILLTFFLLYFLCTKKNLILKIFFKSAFLLIISIFIINFTQIAIDSHTINSKYPKKHYVSIIDYTAIKIGYKFDNESAQVPEVQYLNFIQNYAYNTDIRKKFLEKNLDINYLFSSTAERKFIYKELINKFNINNFLFGNGLNSINFKTVNPNNKTNLYIKNAESYILQVLFEIGAVGLTVWIIITIFILKILNFNYKIIYLSLLFLCIFNSYQENILFWVLSGSIIGIGAKEKLKQL
jgi:hypothetical protein